jgi:exonuclease III
MSRAKLTYQDDDGRIVAITLYSEDKNLLVVGTYWPAGGSPEALNKRRDMVLQISNILKSNSSCTHLIMEDMNAKFFKSDQFSNKSYPMIMYREFVNKNGLQPIEEYSDPKHTLRPRTQLQIISTCNANGNAAYCNGRIDDTLLSKYIAEIVHVPRTCETMGYRSDHVPLVAYLATNSLNFIIPVPKPPIPQPSTKNTM